MARHLPLSGCSESPVLQDVSEHLGVFVGAKRAAAADGAGGGSAAAGSPVAAGWLGKGCGTRGVHALRLLQRATQSGKQRRAWVVPPRRRDMAY